MNSNGYQNVRTIACEVGDLIAVTGWSTSTPGIVRGSLVGSWQSYFVGGSTYVYAAIIKATGTPAGFSPTSGVGWVARITNKSK